MAKIGCRFVVVDLSATDNPLLTNSNGFSVAKLATNYPLLSRASAMENPLLIRESVTITNGESVGDCIIKLIFIYLLK